MAIELHTPSYRPVPEGLAQDWRDRLGCTCAPVMVPTDAMRRGSVAVHAPACCLHRPSEVVSYPVELLKSAGER
jgi:hypothetical protein